MPPKTQLSHLPLVLVVDDANTNIELFRAWQLTLGVQIDSAKSGKEALIKTQEKTYAVIIMAISLPGMGGFECVNELRKPPYNCQTPVIFVSERLGDKPAEASYQLGVIDFIVKPLEIGRLKRKVDSLIKYSVPKAEPHVQSVQSVGQYADYLLDNADVGIIGFDKNLIIDYVNYTACILFGKTENHILGQSIKTFIAPHSPEDEWQSSSFMKDISDKKCHIATDVVLPRSGGLHFYAAYSVSPIKGDDNTEFIGWVLSLHDISDQKEMDNIRNNLSSYDELTRLPNRTLFEIFVAKAIAEANRLNKRLGIIVLNLDNFSRVNNDLGPEFGDTLLVETANRLTDFVRQGDIVARLEGDEFAISVGDFKNTQDLVSIAIRLIQIANRPFTINEQELRLGCSIGIATLSEDAKSCYTLIEHAEFSMHQAKVAGGNQYKFYTNSIDTSAVTKLKFAAELRSAVENCTVDKSSIEKNDFVLHYQPQVTIPEQEIFGCEALIRWRHVDGIIAPNDFIPLAEKMGLINAIGHWCIEEACLQIAEWERSGAFPSKYSVAINVSALQLRNKDLLRHIKKSLNTHNISPDRIHFEITETSIMDNPEVAVSVLREISNLGIKIAIDDFGTGYSSLKYLTKLPVDILKIDQSFISDIGIDSGNETIIRGIIHLSEGLGFHVIAEGVETDYQRDFLVSEGCRLAQGFLFYKPMEKDQVLASMGLPSEQA